MFIALLASYQMLLGGCAATPHLEVVTHEQFAAFVEATDYVTEAEQYGWSIVQLTILDFEIVEGATWRVPNGVDRAQEANPVTQVSFNDAQAYCKWAGARLPSYEEYWVLTKTDTRQRIMEDTRIYPVATVNTVGNTWEITSTFNAGGEVRLAGGSYLCSSTTCNGTEPERSLYVSTDTGNTHLGFAVLR